jgi:hypothetical protein
MKRVGCTLDPSHVVDADENSYLVVNNKKESLLIKFYNFIIIIKNRTPPRLC